jgi:hypothetical protein
MRYIITSLIGIIGAYAGVEILTQPYQIWLCGGFTFIAIQIIFDVEI